MNPLDLLALTFVRGSFMVHLGYAARVHHPEVLVQQAISAGAPSAYRGL